MKKLPLIILAASMNFASAMDASVAMGTADTKTTTLQRDTTAVVLVDIQADFTELHKGSLAVAGTNVDYINVIARATKNLKGKGLQILATQDFHPERHISFASTHNVAPLTVKVIDRGPGKAPTKQVMWPDHCVQKTSGTNILIEQSLIDKVFPKGTNIMFDSYSGFYDDGGASTGLTAYLEDKGIKTLIMYGLATDFCVYFSVMDAIRDGFKVVLIKDLCRAVSDVAVPEKYLVGGEARIAEMEKEGAIMLDSIDQINFEG